MRSAQQGLANFLPLVNWMRFRRRNLNAEIGRPAGFAVFACADARQAAAWLLRTDILAPDGTLRTDARPAPAQLVLPGLEAGSLRVILFDTATGRPTHERTIAHAGGPLCIDCGCVARDVAVAVSASRS